jgi:polyisoprenoid-binding protein YceI
MTETIPGYVVGTWDVDPVHSHIGFVARHLMVSKVRGHFPKFEATIVTTEDPLQSTVQATIDTTSVTTDNDQRDADLRSERFFDVEQYPQMTYDSVGLQPHGNNYIIEGSLTARGETRPVLLTVEVNGFGPDPYGGTRAGFSARGELNRLDFGVSYNAPVPGGVLISERIQIEIEIEAVLRKPQE